MFQRKLVEKIKMHILCQINLFFFVFWEGGENLAIYEIIWKNMVEPDKPQMTA